ncbi:hypothetical protein Bca52824_017931 [Brassica carinata]|uniref:Uncharacterized protein n=1 Tax=Brassica carinata TaxID=52824 RepID=A0A8X7VP49_BRACI|nr:hypothetical protein Bca52824_017931 [Brassica carinata]
MFTGGASKPDVARMHKEANAAAPARKKRKRKSIIQTPTDGASDVERVASLLDEKIKGDIDRVEGKVDELHDSFSQLQDVVKKHISENLFKWLALQLSYKKILDSFVSLSGQ